MLIPEKVLGWIRALIDSVRRGELDFQAEYKSRFREDQEREKAHQQNNADWNTKVTRDALRQFALKHDYDPIFLRDS